MLWFGASGLNPGALGIAPFADAFITSAFDSTAQTTYAFGNLAIGAADARRRIVIAVRTNGGTNCTHDSLTANAGAITFTKVVEIAATANANQQSLWQALVATGTTLTAPTLIVSAAPARAYMAAWMCGRGAPTASMFSLADPSTGTLTVPASGLIIAFAVGTSASADTYAWTGIETVDIGVAGTADNPVSALRATAGRHLSAAGESNRTIAPNFGASSNERLVAAAFGAQL